MRKFRPQQVNWEQIDRFLASARRKLVAARKTLDIDEEACYQLAYEAVLKASLGFALSFGAIIGSEIRKRAPAAGRRPSHRSG